MNIDKGREPWTSTIEHDGVTWRAEVDSVDNVRVYAAGELLFIGYMTAGTIRFWEWPEVICDDALSALEAALQKRMSAANVHLKVHPDGSATDAAIVTITWCILMAVCAHATLGPVMRHRTASAATALPQGRAFAPDATTGPTRPHGARHEPPSAGQTPPDHRRAGLESSSTP
jgi:hypothetical protein